jgi:hypothetical protein
MDAAEAPALAAHAMDTPISPVGRWRIRSYTALGSTLRDDGDPRINGLVRVGTYPLPVVGGLLTGRLSKTGDTYAILDGVVSGRIVVTKFLTGLQSVPHPLTPGAYLCGTDRLYLNLRDSICASRDLLEDPTQDGKEGTCDASSFAVRFTSVPSVLGSVVEPGSPIRACGDAWVGTCP